MVRAARAWSAALNESALRGVCSERVLRCVCAVYIIYEQDNAPSASLDEKAGWERIVGLDHEGRLAAVVPLALDARNHSRLRG